MRPKEGRGECDVGYAGHDDAERLIDADDAGPPRLAGSDLAAVCRGDAQHARGPSVAHARRDGSGHDGHGDEAGAGMDGSHRFHQAGPCGSAGGVGTRTRCAAQGAYRPDASADDDARGHDADDEEAQVTDRVALLRRGARLENVTVAYNAVEGGVAIVAGLAAGSVALTGFGVDSVIEVASGVVLWWRLRAELGRARVGPAVEARAARWAGVLLFALAVYIVAESGRRLLTGDRPGESVVGIVLTALSLIVMPLLARAKLRVAASLWPPPHRTRTGYRLYDGATADRIGFIHKAQALGLTLEEVREVLKVAESASSPCEHVRALLSRRLKEVQGRIAELESLQRSLARTLARSRSLPLTRSCVCGIIESTAVPRQRMSRKTRKEKV